MESHNKRIEIEIPEAMIPYVVGKDASFELRRNALLLYPYIQQKVISHGRAAEILGVHKLDLIDLYEQMGFSYYDMIMDETEDDVQTLRKLRESSLIAHD